MKLFGGSVISLRISQATKQKKIIAPFNYQSRASFSTPIVREIATSKFRELQHQTPLISQWHPVWQEALSVSLSIDERDVPSNWGAEQRLTKLQAPPVSDQLCLHEPSQPSPHLSQATDNLRASQLRTQRRRHNRLSTLCQATRSSRRQPSFHLRQVLRSGLSPTSTML